MNHLKRLTVSLTLTFVLAVSVFAGETNTPPCTPGETNTPPCTSQSSSDEAPILGETNTQPSSDVIDLVDIGEAVLWALTLL
jgi:hypothetical protein